MRDLNKFEKDLLSRIVNYYKDGVTPNIASVIEPLLVDKDIFLDFENRKVELRVDERFFEKGNLVDIAREITLALVTLVNLINDLEKKGFLSVFLEGDHDKRERFGQLIVDNKHITYDFIDNKLVNLLLDYSLKSIIVNQSLINFVDRGFQTKEELSKRKKINIAVISIVITAALSIVGLVFSYISLHPNSLDQETIILITEPIHHQIELDSIGLENHRVIIGVIKSDTIKPR